MPQKRQRIFIVGFREETAFDFSKLEVPVGRMPVLGDILEQDVDPKYTLTAHMWKYLQDYKDKHRGAGNGFGFGLFGRMTLHEPCPRVTIRTVRRFLSSSPVRGHDV